MRQAASQPRPEERFDDTAKADTARSRGNNDVRRVGSGGVRQRGRLGHTRIVGERRLLGDHDLAIGVDVRRRLGQGRSDEGRRGVRGRDSKSATGTLESDLKDLGKPDTDAGDKAEDQVDQLSTTLQDGADAIDGAIKGVSDASGVPAAVATVTTTLTTMKTRSTQR